MKIEAIYRRAPWLLAALVLALLVPGTLSLPLIDRDEPRFATATREMITRSDWVVPTFNGHERFDKPILTYWLMRVGYSVFGFTEFGARLHAIAATLVLVLLTWWVGKRWYSDGVGLAAGALLVSALQIFIHGRLALADMPMIACVALACVALKELLDTPPQPFFRNRWWWYLYIALGVGFLAKGPIVFAVPVLALLTYRFLLWRKPLPWRRLAVGPGLLLALAIIATWGIPALIQTDGRFWKVGIGEHVVDRGFEKFNGRGYSPFFYVATSPISLFPWIAFAGLIPWIVWRTWSERTAWLVAWAVAPYVIFTAYATQLPHYVLPAFPALALMLAMALNAERGLWPKSANRFAWPVLIFFGAVVVLGLVVARAAELPAAIEPLRTALTGMLLVLAGLVFGAIEVLANRSRYAAIALLAIVPGAWLMGNGLRQCSLTADSGAWLKGDPANTFCVGAGFSEPSLVFYTGREWQFPQKPEELENAINHPGPIVVVALDE